jgi:hypothetical protein
MNLDHLKEKLGDDFVKLTAYIDDLTGQRDAARSESIAGRKGLKAQIAALETAQSKALEKLGLDSLDDLDSLPEPKGQAEAVKQFETKLKRMETALAEKDAAIAGMTTKHRDAMLSAALEKAVNSHEWIDRDIAIMLAKNASAWEGDELLFTAGDKLVSMEDGIKHIAATKPHLLKAQGAGGSGFKEGGKAGNTDNPWAKDSLNLTAQIAMEAANPTQATKFKADAGMVNAQDAHTTII